MTGTGIIRCFVPPEQWRGDQIALSPSESRHLLAARRADRRETIEIFDGAGVSALARIASVNRGVAMLSVDEKTWRAQQRNPVEFTLFQALLKNPAMEYAIQKAAELGADEIVPALCARSVPRPVRHSTGARHERWEKIILNAAKQCGANFLTRLKPPAAFDDALRELGRFDAALLCSTAPDAPPLRQMAQRFGAGIPRRVAVLIGPEGDFTPEETAAAVSAGAIPIGLGPRILKAETAAVCALCLAMNEFRAFP